MAWLTKLFTGIDPEEEQKRQDDLDAKLAALNAQDYGPGGRIYNKIAEEEGADKANETYAVVQDQMAAQLDQSGDVEEEIDEAFDEGFQEGFANTTGFINKAIATPFDFLFKALPWQVWVVGLIVLFLYMGGGVFLRGLIARRFK